MRDGPAKGGICRAFRIGMNELPILGRVGEQINPRLIHGEPARQPDLLADLIFQGLNAHVRAAWNRPGPVSTLMPPLTGMTAPVI